MKNQPYYTLLAGLPFLPRFDRAERLPISRERLEQRMRMLHAGDFKILQRAAAFLTWQKEAQRLTDEAMVHRYEQMVISTSDRALINLFDFALDQRTIMAALRRRHRGLGAPSGGSPWGVGQYVRFIEEHWESPHFGLARVYPWIKKAKEHLLKEEVIKLDRLLKNFLWDHLDRSVPAYDFGFRAVMAYRMKWDMVEQWLTHNRGKAGMRFNELVKETIHGQPKLFH